MYPTCSVSLKNSGWYSVWLSWITQHLFSGYKKFPFISENPRGCGRAPSTRPQGVGGWESVEAWVRDAGSPEPAPGQLEGSHNRFLPVTCLCGCQTFWLKLIWNVVLSLSASFGGWQKASTGVSIMLGFFRFFFFFEWVSGYHLVWGSFIFEGHEAWWQHLSRFPVWVKYMGPSTHCFHA